MKAAKNLEAALAAMLAALIVAAGSVLGAHAALAQGDYTSFQSPSGNMHCAVSTTYASCEVREYSGKIPPRPIDCDLDWVPGASVNVKGQVSLFGCRGDTNVDPANPKLAYGRSIKRGVFTCTSAASGVSCKVKSGRGFLVSRAVVKRL
jgi:hypothetical protein